MLLRAMGSVRVLQAKESVARESRRERSHDVESNEGRAHERRVCRMCRLLGSASCVCVALYRPQLQCATRYKGRALVLLDAEAMRTRADDDDVEACACVRSSCPVPAARACLWRCVYAYVSRCRPTLKPLYCNARTHYMRRCNRQAPAPSSVRQAHTRGRERRCRPRGAKKALSDNH